MDNTQTFLKELAGSMGIPIDVLKVVKTTPTTRSASPSGWFSSYHVCSLVGHDRVCYRACLAAFKD